jgi:hypothetical protein
MPFKLHEPPAAGMKKMLGPSVFFAAFLLRFFVHRSESMFLHVSNVSKIVKVTL